MTTNHRTEAEGLIRSVREHGDTADYAVLAVAEAVLDLADAVRAAQPPRKGPILPVTRRAAPTDGCQCGHTRAMHHAGASLGDWGPCRSTYCQCQDFTVAEPWPNN